jgi:predicted O-methyltransferase YrrM
VARFRRRAAALARKIGDEWALEAATGPEDLATLLELAAGRSRIAELGTATGWTTASFALAEPRAQVASFDPVEHEHRERYLALAGADVRLRLELVRVPGAEGAAAAEPVDMLFIDSTHEREGTLEEFRAWEPRLEPGAVVAFHDYAHADFPGVAEAVFELGLRGEGEVRGGLFVWRAPV